MRNVGFYPIIEAEKCTGCNTCVDFCPIEAIELRNNTAVIDTAACRNCRACVYSCPTSAIS